MLRRKFFYLLVAICLLLGMMGPAQVLAAQPVHAPAAPLATTVTVVGTPKTAVTTASASTISITGFTTGTGTNLLMLVGVSWNCGGTGRTIQSVVFTPDAGGSVVNLNERVVQQTISTTQRYAAIWYAVNPPSGTTGTIAVTFSGAVSNGIVAGVATFAGVDQTTPFTISNGAAGTSTGTTQSVTVASLTGNELVFDTVFIGGTADPTVDTSQTRLWTANGMQARGTASTEDAAGNSSVTMSWTTGTTAVVWAIVAVAIKPAPVGTTYNLTMAASPTGGGTTVPTAGVHTYPENEVVNLLATPNAGYVFSGWTGHTDCADGSVTMDADKSCTASFTELPKYTLTVNTTGSGSVTLSPIGGTYYKDTTVRLTATPGPCYVFSSWTGDDADDLTDNGDGTWSITMDANKSVTANFAALPQYALIAGDDGHGSVTLNPEGGTYCTGTTVTLTPVPDAGYFFDSWSGTDSSDIINTIGIYTIVMNGNKSVMAHFAESHPPYPDGAVSSGTGAPNASSISFNHTTGTGTNRLMLVGVSWNCGTTDRTISSITFTPDGGSALSLTEVKTQQYTWPTNNYRYTAIYSLLNPDPGVSGTVNITFSGAVSNGIIAGAANFAGVDQTTPLGTPNGAVGTGSSAPSNSPSVTLTGLTGNELVFDSVFIGASSASHTLTPDSGQSQLWSINGYSLSTSFNVIGAASTKQATGTSATMSWTAEGYGTTATRWAIAAVPIKPAPICYTLTTAVDPTGSGSVSADPAPNCNGSTQYIHGTSVQLTASANTGYEFVNWSGDASGSVNPTTITMDAAKSVTANFQLDEAAALAWLQANTVLSSVSGTIADLKATFPASIPPVIVAAPYVIDSRLTLAQALPTGTTVTVYREGVPVLTDITLIGTGPFWFTELFDPDAPRAPFDAGYGGAVENYIIALTGPGTNPLAFETTVTIESVISKDGFSTETVLDDITLDATIPADEAAALAWLQANTVLSSVSGTIADLKATFPASIPPVIVAAPYVIDSRLTLAQALPTGTTVTVYREGVPVLTDIALIGTGPFWFTELFDPDAPRAPFDAGYGGAVENYVITLTGPGTNPLAFETTVTIESVISKDDFTNETVLDDITLDASIPADEAAALAWLQANTTLTGDLDELTATFPPSIPPVIVAEPYKINSRMTLADSLPAGSTVTIQLTVNDAGPFDYVTDAPIPASPFWVTELFDPTATPAAFGAGYGDRVEVYNITITSGGNNPKAIDTTLKVESIISKDDFTTEEVLAVLDNIPVHVDADENTLTITTDGTGSGTVVPDVGPHIYDYGTIVTLEATADLGSTFEGWSGDAGCDTGSVTMDADKTCTATFTLNTHALSVSVTGDGTVTSSPAGIDCGATCSHDFDYGTDVTLSAAPATGWTFSGWSGDLGGDENPTTITVDADRAVTANFVDAAAPETTITTNPSNPSNSADAAFTFSSSETGSSFECQLDGGGYAACTSPKNYTGLSDGSHTFDVRATDAAGNTDPTPASYTWTIDTPDYLASCTGCTITTSGSNVIYTFAGNGTFTPLQPLPVDVLVVAGGGGGGGRAAGTTNFTAGGGGGGGGFVTRNGVSLSASLYTVTVGAGGSGGSGASPYSKGGNGGASSIAGSDITTISATGGGGGGTAYSGYTDGNSGGSGGGGGRGNSTSGAGGAGTADQGNAGSVAGTSPNRGGGGGGAGAAGSLPNGGDGLASSITGTSVYYAGGGGGGAATPGTGGAGGGGAGNSSGAGYPGAANTGGGGGGGGGQVNTAYGGGAGGSGIVVISYTLAPTVITSGTLSNFSTEPGTPSVAQTYTVSGSNLTSDISVTAPAGFEISTDGSTYSSSLTLKQSGGSVSSTVYVRLTGADEGTFSGNIVHTSSGVTDVYVAVSGTVAVTPETIVFQDGLNGYSGTRDTYIYDVDPATVRGTETTFVQDKNTSDERRSLLLFDLSAIPTGSTIVSAELQFYVDTEGQGFSMYRMLASWDEATVTFNSIGGRHFQADGTDAESKVDANWPGVDGYTGKITVSVPPSTIQDWVDGTLANNGWLMIATHSDDGQQLRSREHGTQDDRPRLTVEYFSSTVPMITITGTPLDAFTSQPGTPSAEQSYTVSGSNLTADIEITAPSDFEISTTSGSGFSSSLTLPQSGGYIAATPIYVRFNRTMEGTSSGDITHTSSGATTQNVAVSGTAAAGWIAYNDCGWISDQTSANITTYQCYTNGAGGQLKNYIDGANIPITLLVTTSGTVEAQDTSSYWGAETAPGTDAYTTFHGIADLVGGIRLTASTSSYVELTFNGLNPDHTYGFVTTANRANSEYSDRITKFTLSDVNTATNESTTGVTVNDNLSVSFCTGYNTVNGYVARWTGVEPGPDGDFVVRLEVAGGDYAYGPAVFMLRDESGGPINRAPNAPVLVQPTDGAAGVSIQPTLEVTVSDPDDDALDVTFYGRPVGTGTPGDDFTLIALPDTQNEAQSYPEAYKSQTQWIANNKATENIVFATHLGDIVNTATDTIQWANADTAMDYLDTGSVAYSVGPGNHDIGTGSLYETYFGVTRFSGMSWYGGHYGDNNYNNYSLFSASGLDFILINLQYDPTTDMLDWADARLKEYSNRRGIVVSHRILNLDNSWSNEGIFTALKDNANLFLMLCGHWHSTSDGAAYREEQGDDGHTIHIMLADYQDYPSGGNGYLRVLKFSPANDTIYATTYSPYVSASITTYPDQMEMAYDMGSSEPFEIIGTASGVASGSNASITWTGLDPNAEYEWYAKVSDGKTTTTGSTWDFATGSEEDVPAAPAVSIELSGSDVRLSWLKVTTDASGGSLINDPTYKLFRSDTLPYFTPADEYRIGEPEYNGTDLEYWDMGVAGSPGMCFYIVRATNSAGDSDDSDRQGVFTFPLLPGSTD